MDLSYLYDMMIHDGDFGHCSCHLKHIVCYTSLYIYKAHQIWWIRQKKLNFYT